MRCDQRARQGVRTGRLSRVLGSALLALRRMLALAPPRAALVTPWCSVMQRQPAGHHRMLPCQRMTLTQRARMLAQMRQRRAANRGDVTGNLALARTATRTLQRPEHWRDMRLRA